MNSEIRSYRRVFDLERRIYRVDRVRLNPAGVPLRGAAYFLVLLLLALLTAMLPLVGTLARVLPWYARDLAVPIGAAAFLTAIRIDGRPFHVAAGPLARYVLGPSCLQGCGKAPRALTRWRPGAMVILPAGSEARLRRLRFTGPAEVQVEVAHERIEWRELVAVHELRGPRPTRRAPAIVLRPGACLRVR